MAAATILCASGGWTAETVSDPGSWKLASGSKK
jgi:hypothetical protein